MLKSVKFAVLFVIAAASAGCSRPPVKQPAPPVAAPEAKVEAPAPAPKPTASFTLDLSGGWQPLVRRPFDPDDNELQLIAVFENEVAEDVTIMAGVQAVALDASEADTFRSDIRDLALEREDSYLVKERSFKLGDLDAWEFMDVRMTEHGPKAAVSVAVTDGKVGYVVACGGDMKDSQAFVPVCRKIVESFRAVVR